MVEGSEQASLGEEREEQAFTRGQRASVHSGRGASFHWGEGRGELAFTRGGSEQAFTGGGEGVSKLSLRERMEQAFWEKGGRSKLSLGEGSEQAFTGEKE